MQLWEFCEAGKFSESSVMDLKKEKEVTQWKTTTSSAFICECKVVIPSIREIKDKDYTHLELYALCITT